MINLTEANPNDLAFQPLVGRPAPTPASYRLRIWGWVKSAPSALIGINWETKVAPINGASRFDIIPKDLKAYIFQFLDLGDLAAASLVSKEWNQVVGTYVNIWGRIALQIKCPLLKDVPDARLQTLRFIRELQEFVRGTAKNALDLTKIVKVRAPTISDLNAMRKWLKARDALVVWSVLARGVGLVGPELEKLKTLEEILDKAKEFEDWFIKNKTALDEFGIDTCGLQELALTSVPKELWSFTTMSRLALSCNQIKKLPEEIGFLKNLEYLWVDSNKLRELPSTVNNLTKLKFLSAGDNQFGCIPPSIIALSKLEQLGLGWNKLTEVPEEICELKALQHLYLNHNQLTKLPEELGELKNLEILNVKGNQITAIPDSVATLPNLRNLLVQFNPLPLCHRVATVAKMFYRNKYEICRRNWVYIATPFAGGIVSYYLAGPLTFKSCYIIFGVFSAQPLGRILTGSLNYSLWGRLTAAASSVTFLNICVYAVLFGGEALFNDFRINRLFTWLNGGV